MVTLAQRGESGSITGADAGSIFAAHLTIGHGAGSAHRITSLCLAFQPIRIVGRFCLHAAQVIEHIAQQSGQHGVGVEGPAEGDGTRVKNLAALGAVPVDHVDESGAVLLFKAGEIVEGAGVVAVQTGESLNARGFLRKCASHRDRLPGGGEGAEANVTLVTAGLPKTVLCAAEDLPIGEVDQFR